MKIAYTLDTNMLQGQNGITTNLANNLKYYKDYINVLKKKDKENELVMFIPEIVIKEILRHEEEKLSDEYARFVKSNRNYEGLFYNKIDDAESKIQKRIKEDEKFVKKMNVLKVPICEESSNRVIYKAINQIMPFKKNNGDAGYKDALIWESILFSDDINNYNLFYYFTCDKDFDSNVLEKEFKEFHKNCDFKLIVIENNDNNKRQRALSKIIEDNNLLKTDIVKLYNENIVLDLIKTLNNEDLTIDNTIIKILFNQFTVNDFDIADVIEEEDKYKVIINIHTFNHDGELKEKVTAKMSLYVKIEGNNLIYDSHITEEQSIISKVIKEYANELSELSNAFASIGSSYMNALKVELDKSNFIDSLNSAAEQLKAFNNETFKNNINSSLLSVKDQIERMNIGNIVKEINPNIDAFTSATKLIQEKIEPFHNDLYRSNISNALLSAKDQIDRMNISNIVKEINPNIDAFSSKTKLIQNQIRPIREDDNKDKEMNNDIK